MPKHLPPKGKPIELMSFKDFLDRVPIKQFQHDYVPKPVRLAGEFKSWYRRRELADPNMQSFDIRSELTKNRYTFLTRVDWRGLFVPLVLVPPTLPADDYYKEYHQYAKPDAMIGQETVMDAAKALITEFEKSEWKRANPNLEPFHRFWVNDHKKRAVPFLTRPGWRGIWVHEVIAREDLPVEPQKPSYRLYKTPEEASGETEVRRISRAYLAEAENITTARTLPKRKRRIVQVGMTSRQSTQLADIRNYLSIATKVDVSEQATLKWILDKSWDYLLPDDYKTAGLVDNVAEIGSLSETDADK